MIIVLKKDITKKQMEHLLAKIEEWGLKPMISEGVERTIIGLIGEEDVIREAPIMAVPGVEQVMPVLQPFKLVSREFKPKSTEVKFDHGGSIGGKRIAIMAGPCAVENEKMIIDIAHKVKELGCQFLRGGAFKPRTSPYTFQGLGEQGLKYLAKAREETGLKVVTEVMDTRDVALVERYADILQIGARNMQNFNLLKDVGKAQKPVLLKRGLSSTVKEFLLSAEYIASCGNMNIILCERGIRTFETIYRNTLDIAAVPVVKELSHLPIIIDPSHAAGKRELVSPLSQAAIAVGADGLIIETHNNPENALSDGEQSVLPSMLADILKKLRPIAHAVGREI